MFKSTIIAIILFMMSLTAGAAPKVLTYEDFVHLSDVQKNAYIIKLMELTVELESRYKKETAEHGFSQERFERYTKILRTLKSVLWMDSAYAFSYVPTKESKLDWAKYASNFNTLMNAQQSTDGKKKDETCIFAGWVSRVIYIDGKPTCTHPDFIDGTGPDRHKTRMAPESKGYPYPDKAKGSTCSKDDKKMIQCNPAIFGFKSISKQSLFCVEASDDAKNSSYRCMKAALSDSPDGDTKDERLQFLRKELGDPKNKTLFNQVWEFTYKTCVCPTVSATDKGNKFFSQNYQDHIRPHRTCYGLMEMMGSTALECTSEVKFPIKDTKIFSDLKDVINRQNITEEQADGEYTKYLNQVQAGNSAEYQRICKGITPPRNFKCESECNPDPADAKKVVCKYSVSEDGEELELDGEASGPQPKDGEKQVSVKFKPKGGKEETVTCDIPEREIPEETPKDTPKNYSCSAECSMKEVTPSIGTDDTPASNVSLPKALVCDYKIKEGDKDVETKSVTGPEPKADVAEVEVKFKLKDSDEEKTAKCNLTYPKEATPSEDEGKEETPTLDVAKDCKEIASCKLTASWDETKFSGWKLSWTGAKTDLGESKTPTVAKDKTKYTVTAVLKKEGKSDVSKAVDIDPLTPPPQTQGPRPAMNYNGTGPMPPQVQIRGTSDTSAIGIK